MKIKSEKYIPTVMIILGATGDLTARKIVPALFQLYLKKKLPQLLHIIGFSRRDWSDADFSKHILKILKKYQPANKSQTQVNNFLKLFSYQKGQFENLKTYQDLAGVLGQIDGNWKVCSNKLFYLAVPPQYYQVIFKNLDASGLTKSCGPDGGWTRVLVEKPFGKDLQTAKRLDLLLGKLFREDQIYRIDHYLAKEVLQNILTFRFSNNLFEQTWNNNFIEKIEISLLEKKGIENRGSFYDGMGALIDVGQNHLLQMLALVTMDNPQSYEVNAIRRERAKILNTLIVPTIQRIKDSTFRAQYKGYRRIKGVTPSSNTETFFKINAFLDSPKWLGVPITLVSGKGMKNQRKNIVVTYHQTRSCLCPSKANYPLRNKVVFSLEPNEEISLQLWSKKPGFKVQIQKRNFRLPYRTLKKKNQYVEEYEKLLLDCIAGDQTLFVNSNEVEAMWKFIDPIVKAWQQSKIPLNYYQKGSEKILEAFSSTKRSEPKTLFNKEIGIIGLGKMGANLARQLLDKGWQVVGYNRTKAVTQKLEKEGLKGVPSLAMLSKKLGKPRIIWVMLPAGKIVDDIFEKLSQYLVKGDIIIDGGNSFYRDSIRRAKILQEKGIKFIDVGISGGPEGARKGACLMVGGDKELYQYLSPLYTDLAVSGGVKFFKGIGAGHFVKMIHNGIEYGMMQAIAEGFTILKKAKYKIDLKDAVSIYNNGSVIESKLINWLKSSFEFHGQELKGVSGSVGHTGEGEWTVKTAEKLNVEARIIKEALRFRIRSEKKPSYTGKVLSSLREQFGGHLVVDKKNK